MQVDPNPIYLNGGRPFLIHDQPTLCVGWVMWIKCGLGYVDQMWVGLAVGSDFPIPRWMYNKLQRLY